jgi:hypothetical protein
MSARKKVAAGIALGVLAISGASAVAEHISYPNSVPSPEDEPGAGALIVQNNELWTKGEVLVQLADGDTPISLAQKIAAKGHIEEVAKHIKNQTEERDGVAPTGAWAVLNEQEITQDSPSVAVENVKVNINDPNASALPVVTYKPPQ